MQKIGSAVFKHSENLKGFGFSAKKLAENPKESAGINPQNPPLFGCMPGRIYLEPDSCRQRPRAYSAGHVRASNREEHSCKITLQVIRMLKSYNFEMGHYTHMQF